VARIVRLASGARLAGGDPAGIHAEHVASVRGLWLAVVNLAGLRHVVKDGRKVERGDHSPLTLLRLVDRADFRRQCVVTCDT
jgi:hypothetical protein